MVKVVGKFFEGSYPISQVFGVNPGAYARYGMKGHNGVDWEMPNGVPIFAGVNGKVTTVANNPDGYGLTAKVWDPSQHLEIRYAHLQDIRVSNGQQVSADTVIGLSDNTGNSTGPHLHIGVGNTDVGGNRTNRSNGYDGYLDPLITISTQSFPQSTTKGGETTTSASGYTGPTPPPYAPTHAGQTVSVGGNNFRSDDGKTWIFQGSDAARAAAQAANDARELAEAEAKAQDAGVYLQKANLVRRFASDQENASDYGLADAKYVIIRGPYKATVFSGYRGGGDIIARFSGAGTYPLPDRRVGSIRGEVNLPPPAPPLPDEQATVPGGQEGTPPGGTQPPTPGPLKKPATEFSKWPLRTSPAVKKVYDLIVDAANKILGQFQA